MHAACFFSAYWNEQKFTKIRWKKDNLCRRFLWKPNAGIIDKNEKYCVTVGCGIIVYRLSEPFEEYMYDKDAMQWMSVEYAEEIGVFT